MDGEEQNKVEPEASEHWLSVAADFDHRMNGIERRQTNLAMRLTRLESGNRLIGGGDDSIESMIGWIMILGIASQILVPVVEALVHKWQSSS